VSDSRKLGVVLGEASPTEFYFVADENKQPSRWEYVVVKSRENVDGEEVDVDIVAQVDTVYSLSMALSGKLSLDVVEKIRDAGLVDRKLFAKARVLGFLHNGAVLQPRRAIYPGNDVFRAPEDILKKFYSYPEEEGLFVGHLITRRDVPVSLSIRGFRRHLAILAQTGAGKSYVAGVLLEELLKKGATVIVLDPHADYVFLSRKKDGGKFSDRVSVFRTPESTGRYGGEVGRTIPYEVKFSDLTVEEILTVCGISEKWTNIANAINNALKELKKDEKGYDLKDLIERLENGDLDAQRALNYVRRLSRIKVFGSATTSIDKLLRPKHISVVDLSGLDDRVSDYIAFRILSSVCEKVETQQYKYPVFIFIEEAHRFIPSKENTLSKRIVKRIAAEGRKFGIFLVLITQRPYKIDSDVLSQCNSQIIMRMTNPEDQKAVRMSSERMSESLLNDLPGLNVGEAIVVGEVTRAPVMIRVRERITREGGADIDVVGKLREAVREAEEEEERREEELKRELDEYRSIVEG